MENFDDIFAPKGEEKPEQQSSQEGKLSWAEKRKQERQAMFDMVDASTERLKVSGEAFQDYLDVQSRFDRYSMRNAILIAHQNKDAVKLATFEDWKADGISIQKGAKSITIMVPSTYRKAGGEQGNGFNAGKVFDISQTTAVAAETKITHDPRRLLEALVRNAPCPIEIRNNPQAEYAARFDPQSRKIYVKQGLDADTLFRCITQEIAVAEYAKGHRKRSECDFDASCIAYILCKRFGVPTDSFNFDKLPERLSRTENKAVHAELAGIRETANRLSEGMQQILTPRQRSDRNRDAR